MTDTKIPIVARTRTIHIYEPPGTPGLSFRTQNPATRGHGFTWRVKGLLRPPLYYPTLNDAIDGAAISLCSLPELSPYSSPEMREVYQGLLEQANAEVQAIAEAADTNPPLTRTLKVAQLLVPNPLAPSFLSRSYSAHMWRHHPPDSLPPTPTLDALARHWRE